MRIILKKNVHQSIKEDSNKNHYGEILSRRSQQENLSNIRLLEISQNLLPQYGDQWNIHNLVSLNRLALSRIIYYHELYQKIIHIPGVICEFGVQWGATLAILQNLRGMYEPYNHTRKIYGFDTFEGFPTIDSKDGAQPKIGDYRSSPSHEDTLEEILSIHETFCPLSHIKKYEIVKGDASETIDTWLEKNPHAIVSMAIFDMDVYKPTKDVLEKIIPRLTKGSLLIFDELNCQVFPGETIAVQEVLGLNNLKLNRHPHQSYCAWAVYGE
jgi:hypothetical protein